MIFFGLKAKSSQLTWWARQGFAPVPAEDLFRSQLAWSDQKNSDVVSSFDDILLNGIAKACRCHCPNLLQTQSCSFRIVFGCFHCKFKGSLVLAETQGFANPGWKLRSRARQIWGHNPSRGCMCNAFLDVVICLLGKPWMNAVSMEVLLMRARGRSLKLIKHLNPNVDLSNSETVCWVCVLCCHVAAWPYMLNSVCVSQCVCVCVGGRLHAHAQVWSTVEQWEAAQLIQCLPHQAFYLWSLNWHWKLEPKSRNTMHWE